MIVLFPAITLGQYRDTVKYPPSTIDERLFYSINHWGDDAPFMDEPMKFLTNTAFIPVTAIPLGLFFAAGSDNDMKRAALSIGTGIAGSVVVGELLIKNIIQRKRPFHVIEGTRLISDGAAGFSFPSGHTTTSVGLVTGLAMYYPQWYIIAPAVVWSSLVILSRPYLGVHYPTDLLGGIAVGIVMQFLSREITRNMYKPKQSGITQTSIGSFPLRIGYEFTLH